MQIRRSFASVHSILIALGLIFLGFYLSAIYSRLCLSLRLYFHI